MGKSWQSLETKTLNVCHRFSWPQRLFCGSYCRKVHVTLCTWSIWALCEFFKVVFHRYTFSSSVFYSCSHAVSIVYIQTGTVASIPHSLKHFYVVSSLQWFVSNSHEYPFSGSSFEALLYSTKGRVRHGGNWGPGPIHITQEQHLGSFHQGCKFIESRNFSTRRGLSGQVWFCACHRLSGT